MPTWPEFLSLAVHELRTPAGVVAGYLRMLHTNPAEPLSDRQRKMIAEAEKSCARLVAIVAEMSEVSKLEAGLIQIGQQSLDLFAVAGEVANGVHEAHERDMRIEVRGLPAGAPIRGDLARLRQAFSAIFRAIVREQPSECTVVIDRRIEVRDDASSAVIVIAAEAAVQAAYESAREPFDEKRGGLGLALPLARRVVEAHAGHLSASSGAAVRGAAIISFLLPELRR